MFCAAYENNITHELKAARLMIRFWTLEEERFGMVFIISYDQCVTLDKLLNVIVRVCFREWCFTV